MSENGQTPRPKHPDRWVTDRASGAVQVKLTIQELRLAFDIGLARQRMNLAKHAEHYVGYTRDGLWQHTKGAVGEIAASLYFDRPIYALATLGDYDAPDVPPNLQVRCSARADSALYLYKQKDRPEDPFILAIWDTDRSLETVTLVGWAYMKDVARAIWWNPDKGEGEWKVPPSELRPMAELKALNAERRALEDLARVKRYKAILAERAQPPVPIAPSQPDPPNPLESDF